MKLKQVGIVLLLSLLIGGLSWTGYQGMQASERRVRNMESMKDTLADLAQVRVLSTCQPIEIQNLASALNEQAKLSVPAFGELGQTPEFQKHIGELLKATASLQSGITSCAQAASGASAIDQSCKACHRAIRGR